MSEENAQDKPAERVKSDLKTTGKIISVSDLMANIENEINDIKSGEIKEAQGRLIFTGRRLQLRTAEIYLQAARLEDKLRPGIVERIGSKAKDIPI